MHIKQALAAYRSQKYGAERRGIEFQLTFKEWCDWWGEDIEFRGNGHDKLQMQRVADFGPYALWNIRKGYPRDNSKTVAIVRANRRTEKAAEQLKAAQDALMYVSSADDEDEFTEDQKFYRSLGFGWTSGFGRGFYATDR